MEEFLQNGGLCHLAEKIFDYLPDKDLAKFLLVSKSWHSFLTSSVFWKQRWIRKLDLVLAQNRFVPRWEDNPFIHPQKPLCEYYPEWKDICNYMKNDESLANFQLFVNTLEELSEEKMAVDRDPLELALCYPKTIQNPKLKIRNCPLADEFIKLLLKCPGTDFSDSLNIVIGQNEYEKIELLLNHGDKTKIDVNSKEGEYYEFTALHTLAEDWLCHSTEPYMKIMFDNAEKYGLDINIKNYDGFTPFELMCWVKPHKRRGFSTMVFQEQVGQLVGLPRTFYSK